MARWRKVECGTWADGGFKALTAAQPNGQTLWLYLLCGPRTTTFPGLVVAREAVMADDLGWSVEAFREAFAEVSHKGMAKADWKAGLVVLPKALIDSVGDARGTAKPDSPNVLKSWARSWDEIPDCPLKGEYLRQLEGFAKALDIKTKAFGEAYRQAFRKALAKGYPDPLPNQEKEKEQEKEQEKEREREPAPVGARPSAPAKPRKVKAVLSESELVDVTCVVTALNALASCTYSVGTHQDLIAARLREGYTVRDLEAVAKYCAIRLDWKSDPKMQEYLRPETLYGPKKIKAYIDQARSWMAAGCPPTAAAVAAARPLQLVAAPYRPPSTKL